MKTIQRMIDDWAEARLDAYLRSTEGPEDTEDEDEDEEGEEDDE